MFHFKLLFIDPNCILEGALRTENLTGASQCSKIKNMNISQVDLQMQYTSGASICICASTSQLLN